MSYQDDAGLSQDEHHNLVKIQKINHNLLMHHQKYQEDSFSNFTDDLDDNDFDE